MQKDTAVVRQNLGVDVAKDSFEVAFSTMDQDHYVKVKATRSFANNLTGFKHLLQWLEAKKMVGLEVNILLEATGIYYEQLAWYLHQQGFNISVILPTKAKRYLQATGHKSKNDKMDAKGLARMGLEQRLPLWQPVSQNIYRLRLLTRQLEDFNKQRTALLNQLHALHHSAYPVKEVEKNLKKMIVALEKGILDLEKAIHALIEQDDQLREKVEKITAIKGVGIKTVAVLLAETNGFATFENQGQLVSYAGYDIVENQSGKKAGTTRMSKKGNAHIRRAMHLPAFGVVRYQEPCFVSLYQRLIARGKTKMQAYVAVQRKLLILIWALWRKNESYDPVFTQKTKVASNNNVSESLFSLESQTDPKKVAPAFARATQDELPCDESPEALFHLL
jgi:transposase